MKLKFKFSGNIMNRFLDMVEKGGNILPHPASLFAIMALFVVVMSGIATLFDISAVHPGTGEIIKPVSLLNGDGLRRIITNMVRNFTGFAPLGTVLVAMLGIGVADLAHDAMADPSDLVDTDAQRRAKAEAAMDRVRAKYGNKAVETGYTFGTGNRGKPQRDQEN